MEVIHVNLKLLKNHPQKKSHVALAKWLPIRCFNSVLQKELNGFFFATLPKTLLSRSVENGIAHTLKQASDDTCRRSPIRKTPIESDSVTSIGVFYS